MQPFLNLGKQPIANKFLKTIEDRENEIFYTLSMCFDSDTGLVTQENNIEPNLMFNDTYSYRGSGSKTMRDHFLSLSNNLKTYTHPSSKILEIGSNDGVFLTNFSNDIAFGVEPCGNFAKECNNLGYKTYPVFWNKETANKIVNEQGKFGIIFSANCMCHIPDLKDAFGAVYNSLDDKGVFIFEDPSLAQMINNNSYDQLYDEHLHIFSVTSLRNILNSVGLEIIGVEPLTVHGGSNRIFCAKKEEVEKNKVYINNVEKSIEFEKILGLDEYQTFVNWARKIEFSRNELLRILENLKDANKKVICYGAASKTTTVFNYCNIGTRLVDHIVDITPEKQDTLSPGKHIPVVKYEEGWADGIDYAFLGAWNFEKEIREKEVDFVNSGGKFITHVPTVRFV